MSEHFGSNIKNKLVKILNLFLSIKDAFKPKLEKVEVVEKKRSKKKKNKKNKEENANNANLKNSFSNNNSFSDDEHSPVFHLTITTLEDLWDYMKEISNSLFKYNLKDMKE